MFKKFAIAATVVALSSTAALASNSFGHRDAFEEGSHTVELDLVRASDAGTVVLESLRGDVIPRRADNEVRCDRTGPFFFVSAV